MDQQLTPIPEVLGRYLTPRVQRNLDPAHVDDLYAMQLEDIRLWGAPTLLQTLVFARLRGADYVVDGQHRLAVFARLLANPETAPAVRAQKVHVLVFPLETEAQMEALYRRLATASVPMHPLEINAMWFRVKDVDKYLLDAHGAFLSKSDRPRFPNVGRARLLSKLEQLSRLDLDATPDLLLACLKRLNERAKGLLDAGQAEAVRKKGAFYLGYFRDLEWVDLIAHVLRAARTIPEVDAGVAALQLGAVYADSPLITKDLRREVWRRDNTVAGVEVAAGRCYCCEQPLYVGRMQCGHVVPRCLGGPTALSNLRAICQPCNQHMGVMNLEDYKRLRAEQLEK